jgi:hypothetical protein
LSGFDRLNPVQTGSVLIKPVPFSSNGFKPVYPRSSNRFIQNSFFNMNKGLKRRFPWCHIIKPYNSNDLTKIMLKMIKDMKWETCFQEKDIVSFFNKYKTHFKYYGGDIETFLTKCKMCHSKRVFSLDNTHKYILNMEDLESSMNMIIKSKESQKDDKEDQDDQEDKPPPFGLYI